MADEKQQTYPDIPNNQWWKLRGLFSKRLLPNINLQYLQDALGTGPQSARGIYRNLQLFGFVDKDGNTTERANQWRLDDQYSQVCKDIMTDIYPAGLLDAAVETVDRAYLVSWFVRNTRVSTNYAGKNAAVFELLRDANPNKGKEVKSTAGAPARATIRKPKQPVKIVQAVAVTEAQPAPSNGNGQTPAEVKPEKPALPDRLIAPTVHIDIQLHIAPDAPASQIEEIFAAIAKHLYKSRSGE